MLFENPVPLNMRLRMQPRSVIVNKLAGIFTKRIWQPSVQRWVYTLSILLVYSRPVHFRMGVALQ